MSNEKTSSEKKNLFLFNSVKTAFDRGHFYLFMESAKLRALHALASHVPRGFRVLVLHVLCAALALNSTYSCVPCPSLASSISSLTSFYVSHAL